MKSRNQHIILTGFKHAGKSVIGQQLAIEIGKSFIDLDQQIEDLFRQKFNKYCSSRQIVTDQGEAFFRDLETEALRKVLQSESAVIALGGGTPIALENQAMLKPHLLVYIKASQKKIFERIMANGQPAFFSSRETSYDSFKKLWKIREKIYRELANFSVNNNNSIMQATLQIREKLRGKSI